MNNTELEIILNQIDLNMPAPERDPLRQYYFIKKLRQYVASEAEKLGRPLTACTTTFGCQMNARDSEKLAGILEQAGEFPCVHQIPTGKTLQFYAEDGAGFFLFDHADEFLHHGAA